METKRNEGGCTEIERERGERGKGIRGGEKSDKGGRDLLLLLLLLTAASAASDPFCFRRCFSSLGGWWNCRRDEGGGSLGFVSR